jgi:hypothetical protein
MYFSCFFFPETYRIHFSIENDRPVGVSDEVNEYSLTVNNTGPVVLDSLITFYATLYKDDSSTVHPDNKPITDNTTYLFHWATNACEASLFPATCRNNTMINDSDSSVSLTRVYSMFDVLLHKPVYDMFVVAHMATENGSFMRIAEKSVNFVLTGLICFLFQW